MYKIAQRNELTAKVKKLADRIRKSAQYNESELQELKQLITDYLMIDYPYLMTEDWINYSLDRLILEYNKLSGKRIRIY